MSLDPWQIEWNGLTMGDGTPYVVQAMNLLDAPDVRAGDWLRGRRHGGRFGDEYLGTRVVTASVLIDRDDPSTIAEFMRATSVASDTTGNLRGNVPGVADSEPFRIPARLRRRVLPTDQDYAAGIGTATLEWRAADPRIYADEGVEALTGVVDTTDAGAEFPLSFPLSFGSASISGIITVDNGGNFPTPWVASIFGPCSQPFIELVGYDFRVTINATLAAGEFVTLDSDLGAVLYGGTVARSNWIGPRSRWWEFPPGASAVRFGAVSSSEGAYMTLAYRPAWA